MDQLEPGSGAALLQRSASRAFAVKVFLFVILLGPPIGGLPIALFMGLARPFAEDWGTLTSLGEALLFVSLMSYIFGGIPALIAATWLSCTMWPDMPLSYGRVLLVAAVSVAPLSILTLINMPGLAAFLPCGALFSAVACRALAGWLGLVATRSAIGTRP